uniref:enhancer of split mbeta protein-like n=1 Tax=Styela clava TaxID=7725 RepID=UPI0019398BEA|nr:enhancer of split mbeta protein-like [Styela clava]
MPAERRLTSAELRRKTNKPIMEKKRRERINKCLEELKSIVLRSVSEESRPNKLEKADILEMTVRYLRNMKHSTVAKNSEGTLFSDSNGYHRQSTQSHQKPAMKCEYLGYPPLKDRRDSRFEPYRRPMVNASHMVVPSNIGRYGPQKTLPVPTIPFNIPGKYSPIPVSPISSASSKSPSPSGTDSTFDELEMCRFRPVENSMQAYSCQVVPSPNNTNPESPPVQCPVWTSMSSHACTMSNGNRSFSPESSCSSSIEFSSTQSFNICPKSEDFLWRPWGVAS